MHRLHGHLQHAVCGLASQCEQSSVTWLARTRDKSLLLQGRIWTMVAGGGASVIYADTVGDLGFAHELGNYAEYRCALP